MKKILLTLLAFALALPLAHAQDTTWTGGGADNNWSTLGNWNPSVLGGTGNVTFSGTTQTTTYNDIVGLTRTDDDITLGNEADWTLNGNAITLSGGSIRADTATTARSHIVNFDINLGSGGGVFFRAGGSTALIFNGLITGTGAATADVQVRNDTGSADGMRLTNPDNSFTQAFSVYSSIYEISSLANAGINSTIGAGSRIHFGQTNGNGTLVYVGSGSTTDRQIRVGNGNNAEHNGGAIIRNNGTGALNFSNSTFNVPRGDPLATRTIELGGNYTGTNIISGTIQNNATTNNPNNIGVTVSGSTWQLDGTNTYTGATTVSSGTLLINGTTTATSAVSVASGGTLGGNGTIGGAVTVAGTLAPGLSPGTLNFEDDLTLEGTATLALEITGTGAGEFDILNGNGANTLTLAGTLALDNTGYTATLNDTITVFTSWQTITGSFSSITGTDLGGGLSWDTSSLYSAGSLTVVPEPSTYALIGGLLALGLVVRRRRR